VQMQVTKQTDLLFVLRVVNKYYLYT
jgi:hypothetical protein